MFLALGRGLGRRLEKLKGFSLSTPERRTVSVPDGMLFEGVKEELDTGVCLPVEEGIDPVAGDGDESGVHSLALIPHPKAKEVVLLRGAAWPNRDGEVEPKAGPALFGAFDGEDMVCVWLLYLICYLITFYGNKCWRYADYSEHIYLSREGRKEYDTIISTSRPQDPGRRHI